MPKPMCSVTGAMRAAVGVDAGDDLTIGGRRLRVDALSWGTRLDGDVVESFSPDFYLPDQDLYVEITTIKPRQVRRKNRKIRWLLEHYPEINIKLFKRSDFRQLMAKYGLDDEQRAPWIGLESQGDDDDEQ